MIIVKDLLVKILTTIGYSENKEEFVNQFMLNIHLQSLLDLISTLPTDKQEEIKSTLARSQNHVDKITRTLSSYFSKTQVQDALEVTSKNSIEKYIEAINHTLSASQRKELAKIFQELHHFN